MMILGMRVQVHLLLRMRKKSDVENSQPLRIPSRTSCDCYFPIYLSIKLFEERSTIVYVKPFFNNPYPFSLTLCSFIDTITPCCADNEVAALYVSGRERS